MPIPSRTCSARGCNLQVPVTLASQGFCLDHYLQESFKKLDLAADHTRCGQGVDRDTLDWLLVQVDCIVETVAGETAASDPEKNSRLLELLLAIANLHEYARQRQQQVEVRLPN